MSLIDNYLSDYQFSERHACRVAADNSTILAAVQAYQPDDDPLFKALIGLRELPMRLLRKREARPEPFGFGDFTLLGLDDASIVYGLVGRFWKLNYGLRALESGDAFKAFREEDAAKLVLGFQIAPAPDGRKVLLTETRVFCPDRATRLRFTAYWLLIRPASGLIRRRILASIRQQAERGGAGHLAGEVEEAHAAPPKALV